MARATIRCYEELNDYLAADRRKQDIAVEFAPPCPVRHLIESIGVPHTEIELLLLNGESVDLEATVGDGDRISAYPMFEGIDVSPLLRLRRFPLRDPRFFADAQLGRLARHLRLLGFDTLYENNVDDAGLARRAAAAHRIVLSRDRQLLMRREVTHGCHIRLDDPDQQLAYVVARCDLARAARPFSRCMECNAPIEPVDKAEVAAHLDRLTDRYYDDFWRCTGCGRIYWKGSHYRRLQALVERVLRNAR
jgi:uncharacterized protein with PIN domain